MLRGVVLLALLWVLAGCAGGSGGETTTRAQPGAGRALAARPQPPHHAHATRARHRRVRLILTIVNGDTDRRVRGARVTVWRRHGITDSHGVAEIVVPRLRPMPVSVVARGFTYRSVWMSFRDGRKVTLRIYRPELQWPLYGASPERAQSQDHIRLRPPFRTAWSRSMGSLIEFPAVVWGGNAYVGNAQATVRAISMRFGTVIWRHETPHGKMASSPAVWGRYLVYHGMEGNVWVLDRATGRERWHYWVGSPIESSPVVRHGIDYFGAWNGRLYALDLRRHRLRWSRDLGAKITSSAALAGSRLFIGDYGGRIWALSQRTGATRWVRSVNGRVYGTPAVAHRRVFVPSSTGGSLTAFTTSGRYLWRIGTGAYVYSSPAAWGGRVFFGSYNGVFYAAAARTGRILWEHGLGGPISGAAVVVDGVAYAGSFSHRIVGVDVRSGRVLIRFPHGDYVPVSGNGKRLLFHGYSRLYAVEPRRVAKAKHPRQRERQHAKRQTRRRSA
jgi:outer membrane protein assembly factor BamB